MPSVKIREIDTTENATTQQVDYTVLIPGVLGVGGSASVEDVITFSSLSKFKSEIGERKDGSGEEIEDLGYIMAEKLLGLGMTVCYIVIDRSTDLTDKDFWKPFEDKGIYDLRFITDGGAISNEDNEGNAAAIAENMITCAAKRGDAVALIDVPNLDELDVDAIEDFISNLETINITRADGTIENGLKYAASFAPHVSYKGSDKDIEFSGSFNYLSCFALHTNRFPEWFAMAGSIRGVSPFEIESVSLEMGDAANAVLQARETSDTIESSHRAVNTISNIRPYGYIVWGNRTLFPLGDGLVASSFLNIRHLVSTLKKTLYKVARKYQFEPNSDVLWINFQNAITPLLERMKSEQGIRGYSLVQEKPKGKATLKARIRIVPIEAVEDFDLTVELTDSIEIAE